MVETSLTTPMICDDNRSQSVTKLDLPTCDISHAIVASSVTLSVGIGNMSQSLLQVPHLSNGSQTNKFSSASMRKNDWSNDLLTLPQALEAPPLRSRSPSFSKACSDALSKSTISASKSLSTVSRSISKGTNRLLRHKSCMDFDPPHCQQKAFEDGTIVQMIGGLFPPRKPFSELNTSTGTLNVSINVHSGTEETKPSSDTASLSRASLIVMISTPNPVIDVSGDEEASGTPMYSANRAISFEEEKILSSPARSTSSRMGSPTRMDQLVIANPASKKLGPRISASIMPHLDSIVLSDILSPSEDSLPNQTDETGSAGYSTPYDGSRPDIHSSMPMNTETPDDDSELRQLPNSEGAFDEDDYTPALTESADTSDNEAEKTVTQVGVTIGDFSFVSENMGEALKDLMMDLSRVSVDSVAEGSASTTQVVEPVNRWEGTRTGSEAKVPASSNHRSATVFIRPTSTSSILGPMTQADFDASFEEVFRSADDSSRSFSNVASRPMERTNAASGHAVSTREAISKRSRILPSREVDAYSLPKSPLDDATVHSGLQGL